MYAEDGVLMPPYAAVATGHAGIPPRPAAYKTASPPPSL
jgi:hypothetical protein